MFTYAYFTKGIVSATEFAVGVVDSIFGPIVAASVTVTMVGCCTVDWVVISLMKVVSSIVDRIITASVTTVVSALAVVFFFCQ